MEEVNKRLTVADRIEEKPLTTNHLADMVEQFRVRQRIEPLLRHGIVVSLCHAVSLSLQHVVESLVLLCVDHLPHQDSVLLAENTTLAVEIGHQGNCKEEEHTDDNIDEEMHRETALPIILHTNHGNPRKVLDLLGKDSVDCISGSCVSGTDMDLNWLKTEAAREGIPVNILTSNISWEEMKTNEQGLIPCIVQDYKNDQVLMMAWMNRESFEKTLETGRMTYYSRSRQSLWVKGETSGHFQYVKSMAVDCDNDTLLARVSQIGAACHTGNRSCFYRTLVETTSDDTNPLHVFQDVYNVILDRKEHPKEGSYTNYLFDKGIDKILKKVGEENTEIIIAAKNPDPEEIKYEISDYLYHLMVLMAERGVTWDDITSELARR